MMKRVCPMVAGIVLGLLFVSAGLMVLLDLVPEMEPLPEGTPIAMFMGALAPTGYLTFVKVLEVLGGVLVAIPHTRNLGLLVLGPIVVNILAFHVFIGGAQGLLDPMVITVTVLPLYLLWCERAAFAQLLKGARRP